VPRGGIGYGLLKYVNRKPEIRERMKRLAPAQVCFNYLGQLDTPVSESSVFGATAGATGPSNSPFGKRSYLIDVAGSVLDGKLRLQLGYSRNLHQRATIEQLASSYRDELRSIIRVCDPARKRSYTQSDFPLASLTESALKELMRDRVDVEDIYPLSPTQQEMLFHSLALRQSELGFVQLSLTLTAKLDPLVFQQAWAKVLDRHEVLRSAVAWDDEIKPLQIVHSHVDLPWCQLIWSNCSEAEFARQFEDYLALDRRKGFDFSKAPLMRLVLIQRGDGRFSFVWSFHHLLLDGWSLPIVFRDLWMFYTGLLRGEEPKLDPKPSFPDYIAWLKRQDPSESESFWRNVLRGFTSPVNLVAGQEPLASQTEPVFSEEEVALSPGLSRALEALARENELTLNTLFEAGWALLLSRYSGQRDVVFGITVSGRPSELPGIENMVGLFINTLPLRIQVEPADRIAPWLRGVQAKLVDLCRYEHTPRAVVHNCSDLPAGLPLFESTLVFENYPFDKKEAQESTDVLEWRNDFSFGTRASTPLTLIVLPGPQIGLRIAYDGRRFGPAMIRRMVHHLESLLTGFSLCSQGTVADLAMVTQEEARQIVCQETGTPLELAHEMIARHAKADPEKVAVRCDSVLTYGSLEQQSNLLAGRLAAQIKDNETGVAVVIDRSVDLVTAILGVFKAGGTCQVLDTAMSDREIHDALAATMPAIIVAHENTRHRLSGCKSPVIYVGSISAPNGSVPPAFSQARMESLALVLVRPDGRLIPVSHGMFAGALQTLCQPQILNTSSTFIAARGESAGMAVLDLIAPLASGACLVISHASENDSSALIAELAQASRPVIRLQFAAWERLLAAPGTMAWDQCTSLCSGELQNEIAERLVVLGASVWRIYEADEAGIIAAVDQVIDSHSCAIIGNSVHGRRLLVLDTVRQPAAIGVAGHLCIAGDAISHGYLNDPELTAERFVPDPLAAEAGSRVFLTGDRARWRDGHGIELLGRNGSMVQIAGRSIDISQIERELISHPDIVEATVALCEEVAGQTRAVAYFVPRSNSTVSIQGIRAYLRARLPEFMLPSDYVPMTDLPRTPQGAIDVDLLPAAGFTHSFSRILLVGDIESHDILEFQLARIWEEVFDIRPISPDDNFFELGGDSLTALLLASRIKEKLSFDLPLAALFEGATIRDMAAMLRKQSGAMTWSSLVPIKPHGTRPPFFCVHAAGGNVLGFVDLLHHLERQQPFYGLQSVGLDGIQEPYSRVEDMAEHYLRDIRTVQRHGPYHLGGLSFGGVVAFEMARQLRQQGESVALLALIDTWAPLFEGRLLFRQILPPDDFTLLTHYIKGIRHFYEQCPEEKLKLQGLTFSQQIDRVVEQMSGTDLFGSVSREHARRVLKIHLHSARAMRDFEPQVYDGKISVFRASDAGSESQFVIVHPALGKPQVMEGWQQVSTEPIEVIDVPGDHITMIVEPRVRVLAERLNACLINAQYASGMKQ
jgi:non-ribosomal peptide synthase protein (TIGR01720 family)